MAYILFSNIDTATLHNSLKTLPNMISHQFEYHNMKLNNVKAIMGRAITCNGFYIK